MPSSSLPVRPIPNLTLSAAKACATAIEVHALSLSIPMNIAIVDASTHLLHFSRMDNAKITSISIAIDKAFTAAGHRVGTHTYKEAVWPGGMAYGLGGSNGGRFMTVGGGLPIKDTEGRVVGGVGCSMGTPAQDEECARKGVEVVEKLIREVEGRVRARL
ncbi:hypothetical protein MMC30_001247 [Trapelia coarctata]|nr:hypothetical protein [Trapelia coarctata]